MIWSQLLKFYHDCFNENYWKRDKILKLIQYYFIWNEITDDVCIYIIMCSVYQNKVIHYHWFYDQLKSFSILKNMWNLLFKKINLNWITELFLSIKNDQKYNSILIIMCHVMKFVMTALDSVLTTRSKRLCAVIRTRITELQWII